MIIRDYSNFPPSVILSRSSKKFYFNSSGPLTCCTILQNRKLPTSLQRTSSIRYISVRKIKI
ncbi:hypothetical protein V3C99_009452, partial [Haemonchus contortus]